MTVAVTPERLAQTLAYLRALASNRRPAPSNREIALKALKMGRQKYQPWDRTQGIKGTKCEHGAVMIKALEVSGVISVERGSNWRRITILDTGDVLQPQRPRYGY